MARGTKNYFRHHNSAFEDEKIQKAISLLGYEGYAYFFIILEMCAKQCENEFKNPITFHQQSIRNVLRKQSKSCNKVLTKLQESGLFLVTFRESFVEFSIPNLSKYMGQYESKRTLNHSNKIKEKEIKEKKILPKSPKQVSDDAIFLVKTFIEKLLIENPEIKTPTNLNAWQNEADKLLRIDKRDFSECIKIISWALSDSFWKTNILSFPKFRKQYDQLKIKMNAMSAPRKQYDRMPSSEELRRIAGITK